MEDAEFCTGEVANVAEGDATPKAVGNVAPNGVAFAFGVSLLPAVGLLNLKGSDVLFCPNANVF